MEAMLAMILQKVGGIQDAVDQVSARTLALEGAMADVSLSGSGGPPNGSGSMSATPMGAASAERLERAPDQGPSRDGAPHAQEGGDDAATASGVVAAATATGARGEQISAMDSVERRRCCWSFFFFVVHPVDCASRSYFRTA